MSDTPRTDAREEYLSETVKWQHDKIVDLQLELAALRARLGEAEKDAARYQWLLSQSTEVWESVAVVPDDETDDYIDSAMMGGRDAA